MRSLVLAALLVASPVQAETWLSSSLLSYHLDRKDEKNEQNFGLGVKHFLDERNFLAGGFYRNSNEIDSAYGVGGHCLYRSKYLCGGGVLGFVSGYEKHVIVMGGLILTLHGKEWGASVLYFPKDSGVIGFQIEKRLK